jgi:hypothetical protein
MQCKCYVNSFFLYCLGNNEYETMKAVEDILKKGEEGE